jgi:hypothetical protein
MSQPERMRVDQLREAVIGRPRKLLEEMATQRSRARPPHGSNRSAHSGTDPTGTDRRLDPLEQLSACQGGRCQQSTVSRVWRQFGLHPHRSRSYMVSDDPEFEEKAADIMGLYLKALVHAAVFCVDEKSAIQTLDRLDPVLPLFCRPGRTA